MKIKTAAIIGIAGALIFLLGLGLQQLVTILVSAGAFFPGEVLFHILNGCSCCGIFSLAASFGVVCFALMGKAEQLDAE